jgi:hypothetical protein
LSDYREVEELLKRIENLLLDLVIEDKRQTRLLWRLLDEERKEKKGSGFATLTGLTVTQV